MSGCCCCTGRCSGLAPGSSTSPSSGEVVSVDRRRRRVLQSDLLQPQAPEISVPEALRVAPVLVRYAADAWLRAAEWSVGTWFHAASRMARAAAAGDSPAELLEMTRGDLREYDPQLPGPADAAAPPSRTL